MTQMTLTKTGLANGIWTGVLTGAGAQKPQLKVALQGQGVDGLELQHDPARSTWDISFAIPAGLINDGLQTFVISDGMGQVLSSFAVVAGDALAEDIRAEVDLLRSELDLLKSAFRQHCQDSQGQE